MTDVDDDNDLTTSPVDMFEMHLEDFFDQEVHDPRTHASIPRDIARAVLDLARQSQHKGRGKGRVPLSEMDKMRQELVIDEARERKAELLAASNIMSIPEAAQQAATEAAIRLHDEHGMNLAASTIMRRMESNRPMK
jgi:hypothetical protein